VTKVSVIKSNIHVKISVVCKTYPPFSFTYTYFYSFYPPLLEQKILPYLFILCNLLQTVKILYTKS